MGESILRTKSFSFAVRILWLGDVLGEMREFALRDQIIRSGTSIGANVREGRNAQGIKDMINKFSIALKEADETQYWLELLKESGKIEQSVFDSLMSDLNEIISMLVSSVKTLKIKIN
ncbi:MAG: four helix bundle protein [Bacteroidales bacterium]|nr:four helix bundle protein [Bacteroidales bacterium]